MGGIVTSVADFERWDRGLRAGRVLRSTEKLQTPGAANYAGGGWVERTSRGTPMIMLGGNVRGFNSSVWQFPEDRALVVVLCNTPDNSFVVGIPAEIKGQVPTERWQRRRSGRSGGGYSDLVRLYKEQGL